MEFNLNDWFKGVQPEPEPNAIVPQKILNSLIKTDREQEEIYLDALKMRLHFFVDQAIEKYKQGREKYRNDPRLIDYEKEIDEEMMDLIIYSMMRKIFKK